MKSHRGQVAVYLVMVLVAICVLIVMNAGTFLAVTVKNRTMNAGDAAALAVAKYQGTLLNRIGEGNVRHLSLALQDDAEGCATVVREQARNCFLEPLRGISIGNELARENGIGERDADAEDILLQHALDIEVGYASDHDQFPPPWETTEGDGEGAWVEYARLLRMYVSEGLYASPDNIDFIDAAGGHLLLNFQFYNAIAGENWCWFHFNAPDVLRSYDDFHSWGPLPSANPETRSRRCVNSEIYSLHLEVRVGSAVQLFGKELIRALTGCTDDDIARSTLIADQTQVWFLYDRELWRPWWEIDPNGAWQFPVVGGVRPEYDVRGCAACCRVSASIPVLFGTAQGKSHVSRWTAAAKPFGTAENDEGGNDVVTARKRLVLPSFVQVRLVPWDSVGGRDTERPSMDMVPHVRNHLPQYLRSGLSGLESRCYYCDQLRSWENRAVRTMAQNWLTYNSRSCIRATVGSSPGGGTPHAH